MSQNLVPRTELHNVESLLGSGVLEVISRIESCTEMLTNSLGIERSGIGGPTTGKKDIPKEAGYATNLTPLDFWNLYQREGWMARVNNLMPEETWQIQPEIYETEDADVVTEWEEAWGRLVKAHRLWSELFNLDLISGIGRFGIMVFGLNDGKTLADPIEVSYDANSKKYKPSGTISRELMWISTYGEHQVKVVEVESDQRSPRYGRPTKYLVTVDTPTVGSITSTSEIEVHWTRAFHYADNRTASKIFGLPRILAAYNRLFDLWKIAAGSGEGYWQSCNPILSVTSSNAIPQGFDKEALKTQIWRLQNSLQKYLAVAGMEAKMLAPSMVDPTPHSDLQLTLLCIGIGVPKRVFMGAEEGKLAGEQDGTAWGKRKQKRRETETGPVLICGCAEHLMMIGALPFVEELHTAWPVHTEDSEADKATNAKSWTETLVKYAESSESRMVMPEAEYFSRVWGMSTDEVLELMGAAQEIAGAGDTEQQDPADFAQ